MPGDAELVEAFRGGDGKAGERLVDKYYGRILGFFRNKAPSRCNDLAQRTFLGCFEGLGRLRDPGRFRSFLFAVACNQLRKHYEQGRREEELLDYGSVSAIDLDPSPSQVVTDRDQQRLLLEALRRIPVEQQIVLELAFWEEMSASEIAEVLDLPLGTAKTRLRDGRRRLERVLGELARGTEIAEPSVGDLGQWARDLRAQVISGRAERSK